MSVPRTPRATYRIQLNRDFTFAQAAEIVPYLARLGVSHVYCSPFLKARAGSPHGYDIVDHGALNPELGSEADYDHFCAVLAEHGMGQMLDIVPNHMGVGGDDNPWWLDVLENGQASDYAGFFDIDWQPAKPELAGKVLLPLLEDHYGTVLGKGLLQLAFNAARGELSVHYHEHRFPLDPKTYPRVLGVRLDSLDPQHPDAAAFRGLVSLFDGLPSRHDASPERRAQRNHDKDALKQRLAELAQGAEPIADCIAASLAAANGTPGEGASFDLLHALLEDQAYRVAYWRVAADEINYRRFFDVNSLAALRMQQPEVFAATHRLVLDLIAAGKVQALRIDHPDGLYDPAGYFRMLREAVAARGAAYPTLYTVVEKILMLQEALPGDWPVDGTTGYDFGELANGVLVDPAAEAPLTRLYDRLRGSTTSCTDMLFERKKLVMRTLMSGELMVLSNALDRVSEGERHTRDYTLHALRDALMDVIACFPVYRTYVTAQGITDTDRARVRQAVADARRRSPAVDVSVFDFLQRVLLFDGIEQWPPAFREAAVDFVMKLQQYTSPVMAKGFEDTTFYAYNRFVALNEVGCDPRQFAVSLEAFHRANRERLTHWPQAMLATSTHDSKRSEDVRARLDVLSEIPTGWRDRVARWTRLNRSHKTTVDGALAPDGNDEYLLYQTLLGVWPLEGQDERHLAVVTARVEAYMLKAVREAKTHTSWLNINGEYEAALVAFIRALLDESSRNRFLADFQPFQQRVARFGLLNSLTQTLLKLTAPGVPDIYQGSELWEFALVDPDNRRPVDYLHRHALLESIEAVDAQQDGRAARVQLLLNELDDGRAKLFVTREVLGLRRELESLFREGSYEPLTVNGERAEHVCAFLRRHGSDAVVVVAGRWYTRLGGEGEDLPLGESAWGNTGIDLPAGPWSRAANTFTGESYEIGGSPERRGFALAELLARFPVALLQMH